MAEAELHALLSATSPKPSSGAPCAQILSHLRDSRLPRPDLVLEYGDAVLSYLSSTTREWWEAAAEMCSAAGETGEYGIMESLFGRIMERFPHSARTFVLLGRAKEARGQWGDAMRTYMEVTEKMPLAAGVYKRQVAVLKSEGRSCEAIGLLNYYVGMFGEDRDAWAELCALCLSVGRVGHAAFAANELVVMDGGDYAAQCLVGDVYMTGGGVEEVRLARGHYACSLVRRSKGNVRGLFGLWLACERVRAGGGAEQDGGKNERLRELAEKGLSEVYGDGPMAVAVRDMLGRSAVTGAVREASD